MIFFKKNINTDYLHQLQIENNKSQKHVIESCCNSHTFISGAPGTGKTTIIAARILYLIDKKNIDPNKILILTHTHKSWKNIENKIIQKNLKFCTTFHGFAKKQLEQETKKTISIISEYEVELWIKNTWKKMFVDKKFSSDKISKIKTDFSIHKINIYLKKCGIENLNIKNRKSEEFLNNKEFLEIYKKYKEFLNEEKKYDWNDLLIKYHEFLKKTPSKKEELQKNFSYIFVDEGQDMNHIQFLILQILIENNKNFLFFCYDQNQSIFSFANTNNIFCQEIKKICSLSNSFSLSDNYRCTPEIMCFSEQFISQNSNSHKHEIKNINSSGEKIELLECRDVIEQNKFVIQEIKKLLQKNVQLNEIAILFRAKKHAEILKKELLEENFLFLDYTKAKIFESKSLRLIVLLISLIFEKNEIIAKLIYEKLIFTKKISSSTNKVIADFIEKNNKNYLSFFENLEFFETKTIDEREKNIFKILHKLFCFENKTFQDAILFEENYLSFFIEKIKMIFLQSSKNELINKFALNHAFSLVKRFFVETNEFKKNWSLKDFWIYANKYALFSEKKEVKDLLHFSTIHSAKGSEYNYVFILNLSENRFPHLFSKRNGEIGKEEENRLFYVAVTRPSKKLFLFRYEKGEKNKLKISSFFTNLTKLAKENLNCYKCSIDKKDMKKTSVDFDELIKNKI